MSDSNDWKIELARLFEASVTKYKLGHQKAADLVDVVGLNLLKSIGQTEQEFFDFVEDSAKGGDPTVETVITISEVRRDYFMAEQHGRASTHPIDMASLPAKNAEVAGIGWLPRVIAKAEAKLRGEMPPDLMYGCSGDRKFFRANSIDPAEFLRQVWTAGGKNDQVVDWFKKTRQVPSES